MKTKTAQFIALLSLPILIIVLIALLPSSANAVPLYSSLTQDWIKTPWQWVMYMVNILAVIVLIAISIATVLRVENLYYKRLLPGLIIGIVMANLSFLICRLLVDVVQVPTGWIAHTSPLINRENLQQLFGIDNFTGKTAFAVASQMIAGIFNPSSAVTAASTFLYAISIGMIFMLPVAILIGFLSFLLWARVAVIWILVVLSPFAFFAAFIPVIQKMWVT